MPVPPMAMVNSAKSAAPCTASELQEILAASLEPIRRSLEIVESHLSGLDTGALARGVANEQALSPTKIAKSADDVRAVEDEASSASGNTTHHVDSANAAVGVEAQEHKAETAQVNGTKFSSQDQHFNGGMRILANATVDKTKASQFLSRVKTDQELHGGSFGKLGAKLLARCKGQVDRWENLKEPPRSGMMVRIEEATFFWSMSSAFILLNTIVISISSDFEITHRGQSLPGWLSSLEISCIVFFTVEVVLRLWVHKLYFFVNDDMNWNIFDLVLVALSLADLLVDTINTASESQESTSVAFMRILRLLKAGKILRAFRILKVFRELATILKSFEKGMVSLFWSLVMLVFLLFVFSLLFIQGLADHATSPGVKQSTLDGISLFFASLPDCMLSLYMSVTGGADWNQFYAVVSQAGDFYALAFLFFTLFFNFALFNILTGVFVEKAITAFMPDRADQLLEERRRLVSEADDFRDLCKRLDRSRAGRISLVDFMEFMQNETMVVSMASLGLAVHDVELFFKVVAGSRDEVSIEEFVEGCMATKGTASSLDVQKQLFETRLIAKHLCEVQHDLQTKTDDIRSEMDHVLAYVKNDIEHSLQF